MVPSSWLADDFLLVGVGFTGGQVMLVDPTKDPARVDTLGLLSNFVSISPDRKWIAHTPVGATGVSVQPWPAMDRKYTVDLAGREPLWRGANELVYFSYVGGKGSPDPQTRRVRHASPTAVTSGMFLTFVVALGLIVVALMLVTWSQARVRRLAAVASAMVLWVGVVSAQEQLPRRAIPRGGHSTLTISAEARLRFDAQA